jgi:hypothetical protein
MVAHGIPPPTVEGNGLDVANVGEEMLGVPVANGYGPSVPIIDGDELGVGTTTNGLIPALPISTEPKGMPVRATPPGDVDDVAGADDALLLEPVPQTTALPGSDVPIPIPPPSYVLKPDVPDDAPPMAEHVVPKPVVPVPLMIGLSPGDASSVAPMGIPVGGTGEPGVMPSGEVAAMPGVGMPTPPTCAYTGGQPSRAASIAVVNKRRIMIFIPCPTFSI